MSVDDVPAACQRLMETFIGVCGAPDDPDTIAEANKALRHLETLLAELG